MKTRKNCTGSWLDAVSVYPAGWRCPFSDASTLQQARNAVCSTVPQRRYALPHGCPHLNHLRVKRLEGQTLFFLGDSMTAQHTQAFMCRLLLLNYTATNATLPPWAPTLHAPMRSPRHCTPAGALARMTYCRTFAREAEGRNVSVCHVAAGLLGVRCTSVSTASLVRELLTHRIAARGDALIANEGMWLTERTKGVTDVGGAETRAAQLAAVWRQHGGSSGVRLLWREASPQHFETPDGRFNRSYLHPRPISGDERPLRCVPHREQGAGWHPQRAGLAPLEAAGVPIVRVWDLSVSQWDVHTAGPQPLTGGSQALDCTHYCEPSGVLDAWVDATAAALEQ